MSLLLWSRLRNYLYEKQILNTAKAGCYVISIGNLTWGGTGKTSLTKEIGIHLISNRFRIAILSRGYRRKTRGARVISDGNSIKSSWQESGDEAFWLACALPEAIVIVSEERADGLHLAEQFKPDVILLDDAFQHRKVKRNLDLLLIDASENILKQKLIPFGKLRESLDSVKRADAVVLTHQKKSNIQTTGWVSQNVQVPVFHANYVIEDPAQVRGKKIAALCAIGSPNHFYELLRDEGAELVVTRSFRDHHAFSKHEITEFGRRALKAGAEMIVTTAKDTVRMDPAWVDPSVQTIRVKLQILEDALFFDFVMKGLRKSEIVQSRLP